MSVPSQTADGMAAVKAGKLDQARQLLAAALAADPRDATAWLWLSAAVSDPAERRYCLQQVLAIHPGSPAATKGMQTLGAGEARSPLRVVEVVAPEPPPVVAAPVVPAPIAAQPPTLFTGDWARASDRELLDREAIIVTNQGWEVLQQTETNIQIQRGKEIAWVSAKSLRNRAAKASLPPVPKGSGNVAMVLVLTIVLMMGIAFTLARLGAPPPKERPRSVPDSLTAYLMCQDFMKRQLKAPDTATFPSISDRALVQVETVTPTMFEIDSFVTAQNAFGVPLRIAFLCRVHSTDGENWTLDKLTTSENP